MNRSPSRLRRNPIRKPPKIMAATNPTRTTSVTSRLLCPRCQPDGCVVMLAEPRPPGRAVAPRPIAARRVGPPPAAEGTRGRFLSGRRPARCPSAPSRWMAPLSDPLDPSIARRAADTRGVATARPGIAVAPARRAGVAITRGIAAAALAVATLVLLAGHTRTAAADPTPAPTPHVFGTPQYPGYWVWHGPMD